MKNSITSLNWYSELAKNTEIDSIDNDLILFDRLLITSAFDYPFKIDVTTAIICIKGTTEGAIDLKPFKTTAPCLIVILPGQILEHKSISEDFSGLFIIMSKQFTDNLLPNNQDRFPLFLSVRDNPTVSLNDKALEAMISYFEMLRRMVRIKENPYRMEVAKHLTLSFLYGAGFYIHSTLQEEKKSKQEILVEKFLHLVQTHYKEHRSTDFYADKLCMTPKYLSKVVKDSSGMSASEWIDSYVILESKALLKSTNMTVQQVSDELHFPSQSFFGKYFKRLAGVAPGQYKKGNQAEAH